MHAPTTAFIQMPCAHMPATMLLHDRPALRQQHVQALQSYMYAMLCMLRTHAEHMLTHKHVPTHMHACTRPHARTHTPHRTCSSCPLSSSRACFWRCSHAWQRVSPMRCARSAAWLPASTAMTHTRTTASAIGLL